MKFCYIDESGTGSEPYAVMVGVVVDAYRMRLTKAEWDELLTTLSGIVGKTVTEFHTKDFYAGNSPWRGLDGAQRARIIDAIFEWFAERKHHIVYSAIDKEQHRRELSTNRRVTDLGTLWRCLATHIALALQKTHQGKDGNKGHTVLIFDQHDKDQRKFAELLLNPPGWSDSYYDKGKKQDRLDQIIDVPHFVDSSHVGLIQLADCFSYFLRRHLELKDGKATENYSGEAATVQSWIDKAMKRSLPNVSMYPKRNRCDTAQTFWDMAPAALL